MVSKEIVIQTGIQILNLCNPLLAVPAAIGMSIWHKQNVDSYRQKVEFSFKDLSQRMLTRADTEADEFKELILRITREAAETSSDIKRTALADALVNSAFMPKAAFSGKIMLVRVLSQLSEEEFIVLRAIRQLSKEDTYKLEPTPNGATEGMLVDYIGMAKEDLLVTIYGLRQLSLIYEPMSAVYADADGDKYALSPLAHRLIEWCIIEPPA